MHRVLAVVERLIELRENAFFCSLGNAKFTADHVSQPRMNIQQQSPQSQSSKSTQIELQSAPEKSKDQSSHSPQAVAGCASSPLQWWRRQTSTFRRCATLLVLGFIVATIVIAAVALAVPKGCCRIVVSGGICRLEMKDIVDSHDIVRAASEFANGTCPSGWKWAPNGLDITDACAWHQGLTVGYKNRIVCNSECSFMTSPSSSGFRYTNLSADDCEWRPESECAAEQDTFSRFDCGL